MCKEIKSKFGFFFVSKKTAAAITHNNVINL